LVDIKVVRRRYEATNYGKVEVLFEMLFGYVKDVKVHSDVKYAFLENTLLVYRTVCASAD
jgi:hypothetical protein